MKEDHVLSAKEFTVGTFADAKPLTLVLPRGRYDATALVGHIEGKPFAAFLAGEYRFRSFESSSADNWRGLLIPGVRVEMDESSLIDPDLDGSSLGAVRRTDTRLVLCARGEHAFGRMTDVVLEADLPSTNNLSADFSKWRVVLGEGREKRTLFEVDTAPATD